RAVAAGHRARLPEIRRQQIAMKDVSAGQPETRFQVAVREYMPVRDGAGDIRRITPQDFDDAVGELFALYIQIKAGSQVVWKILHEQRQDTPAGRRKAGVGGGLQVDFDPRRGGE